MYLHLRVGLGDFRQNIIKNSARMKQHLKSCIMFKGLLRFSKTREL